MNRPYTTSDVDELYRLIGEAVWHLQHLENIVASFTAYKLLQTKREKGVAITEGKVTKALQGQKGQTLGPLIGTAKTKDTIPTELVVRFERILEERNWLIHQCVSTEYLSLRNNAGKNHLFSRLRATSEEAIALQGEIHGRFEKWFTDLGYNLDLVYRHAEKQLKEAQRS